MYEDIRMICRCMKCGAENESGTDVCSCGADLNLYGECIFINQNGDVVDASNVKEPKNKNGGVYVYRGDDKPVKIRKTTNTGDDKHNIQKNDIKSDNGTSSTGKGTKQVINPPVVKHRDNKTLFQCFINAFKHYADFKGRSSRREYWGFVLYNCITSFAICILTGIFAYAELEIPTVIFLVLYILWMLAVILPAIAVAVRRLHDLGKSGCWYFISFVPFVGGIAFIVLMCMQGEPKSNIYGPPPMIG